ncbi:MAG: acyl-CoA desaturase [bacterium]|nr:acyl-CoA desaturase [bacterium]
MSDQKPPLRLANSLILLLTPFLALVAVPWYGYRVGFDLFEWSIFAVYMALTGLSITVGYHRLWAHKTYKGHFVFRLCCAIWGACALQNSIIHWTSDHRNHHRFVDRDERDPYSAGRGFWFSHMGWILRRHESAKDDFSNVKDVMADPVVQWQHKYYLPIAGVTNVVIPLLLGYWHGNLWGTLLLAGLLRLVLNHHFTFLINSLAHIWGRQTYGLDNTSRDNYFLAFFTYGEGFHNYHHRFQWDYRNGIKWWHFDPSKWVIRLSSWVGLTYRLKYPSPYKVEQARLQVDYDRALQRALSDGERQGLQDCYQALRSALEALVTFQQHLNKKDITVKKEQAKLKADLKHQRRAWREVSKLAA